jgi:glycosyltransferase involved in cell wall biosynthesis
LIWTLDVAILGLFMPTLHVVIPVYNEPGTLEPCVRLVMNAPLPEGWQKRITLVDDHSDAAHMDSVRIVADELRAKSLLHAFQRHDVNRGKGAALQTGFDAILGHPQTGEDDLVIIQDADLEYDPNDYATLMQPILSGSSNATLGTRWGGHYHYRTLKHRIHAMGNGALTWLSNLMTGYKVSDMECCYKMMPIRVLRKLRPMLTESRFGIEPQMVASMSRLGITITEVPIKYKPRRHSAGKKIGWKDGVRALIVITRERFKKQ